MIRVFADMAADLFHYGHVEFLRQARSLGDYLIVGLHGDNELQANKRKPVLTLDERVRSVKGCRWVDEVIPDAPWRFDPSWIEKYGIDLVVHGDDFSSEQEESCYEAPIRLGIYRTLPYTAGISTTEIIRRCKSA